MIFDKDTAEKTAELLLQINAIKLNPKNPFTWASGWNSPIYCDNRLILSFPAIRNFVREEFSKYMDKELGKPDVIAGVATGAIGIGMLVAEYMGLPFVYVRPEPKKHGRQNQVEGFLQKAQNVVVVEDLISTGNSSLLAVEALKEVGANVKGMVAIFTYGFEEANVNLKKAKCPTSTLCDYTTLIEVAVKHNYITENDLESLNQWRISPSTWKQ